MPASVRILSVLFHAGLGVAVASVASASPPDATAWTEQKVSPGDGAAGDNFGYSLAIAGDTAVIGSYVATIDGRPAQGAVYVYRLAGGVWSQTQKLVAGDGAADDQFGEAIALDGDTLLISANGAHVGGGRFAGAVYVFTRSGDVWSEAQKLTAGDAAEYDNFGWSLGLSGDTAVIGAPYADVAGRSDQGAAYVFSTTGGPWTEAAKLSAGDGAADDHFGIAVAIEGPAALIGAPGASVDGNAMQGAAYAFDRTGGAWQPSRKLIGSGGEATDNYGQAVAISGTTALIGAPIKEAVYVLTHSDGAWDEVQTLRGSDAPGNTRYFGYALDLEGAQAIVGAFDVDVDGRQYQGASYVFALAGSGWQETRRLIASDGAEHENFGIAVGISNGVAVSGAYHASADGNPEQGAAYFHAAASDTIFADGFEARP